jgi:DNA invertase Pin-like site-specific DNA recombinase
LKHIISFIRLNNSSDNANNQIKSIANYISEHSFVLIDTIEISIDSSSDEYKINELRELTTNNKENVFLLIYDLNVLGRTIVDILDVIYSLLDSKIGIISINQKLELISHDDMLTKMFLGVMGMSMVLEKDLMSIRTKEALAYKKKQGINLGKPKGTIQKSKFDLQRDKIEEYLSLGLSVRKIAKLLGYNNHIGLNNYVKKRAIRIQVQEN